MEAIVAMQSIVNAGDQFAVEINQTFYDLLCASICQRLQSGNDVIAIIQRHCAKVS
jgi:hypothetical protein